MTVALNAVEKYYSLLKKAMDGIIVTNGSGHVVPFDESVQHVMKLMLQNRDLGGKVYFIGNGASAAIASHQGTDYWKAAGVPSTCFNDPALLTCISNDYGYEHVFEKPVEMFMNQHDTLVCISSSGNSESILNAFDAARKKQASCLTLSGFSKDNKLRQKSGDWNFYVPSKLYGHVEVAHHSILHCILDILIQAQSNKK